MTGEKLYVSERTASLMNEPCCPRDEGSSSAMRTASDQSYRPISNGEEIADGDRRHSAATLRPDHGTHVARRFAPAAQGVAQIGVHWDEATAAFLRRVVPKLDYGGNGARRVQNHR